MGREGSFDIMDSSGARSKRVNKIKNILLVALVIAVVVLAIKVGISEDTKGDHQGSEQRPIPPSWMTNSKDPKGREICMSDVCIEASNRLFKQMNLKADPCDDFNEFACGKFLKEFNIPEDKSSYTSFTPIGETIYERGKALMEDDEDEEWEIFKDVKKMYKSCLNEEKLEEVGLEPLKEKLKLIGGWPVLQGSSWSEDFKWYEAQANTGKAGLGKDYIVSVYISSDSKNSSYRAIYMDQPSLGLQREYLVKGLDDNGVKAYFKYMQDTAVLMGASKDRAEQELREVLDFEIELAEASAPREERRNASKLYNPKILRDLESRGGHPPSWADYVNSIIPQHPINEDHRVIIANPKYVEKLADMLQKAEPRVMANYLGWRLVKSLLSYTTQEARDIAQDYKKALSGATQEPPRWKTCARSVGFNGYDDASLRIPAASMYIKKYFGVEAKAAMVEMISYLRKAFGQIINDLDWMDDKTKEKARKKLTKMAQFIAYPDEMLDEYTVTQHHKGIIIKEDDYFGNVIRLEQWNRNFKYGRLYEKIDKKSWIDNSLVALVNAFYNPTINAMTFPAGILQGVFFDHKAPKYMNLGGIGAVIGHEITHGFDDQGRQYDYEGKLMIPL